MPSSAKLDFRKFEMLCPLAMGYIGCVQDIMYLCSNWLAISLWQGVVSMVWSGDDGVEMILWWDVWTWMPSLIVGYVTQDLTTLLETNVRQLESTFFLTWLSKCTCACMQDRCLDKDFFWEDICLCSCCDIITWGSVNISSLLCDDMY